MELNEIEYIQTCLDIDRKPFPYFKDKYAFTILAEKLKRWENGGAKVAEIKKSDFGFLLNKNEVKNLMAKLPGKSLTSDLLENYWAKENFYFELELGHWGEYSNKHRKSIWDQTSRPGYNLVLRLNFSLQHDVPYFNLIKPFDRLGPFALGGHPVSEKRNTLAWARLDIDLGTGELLIEEIQNDWLREAKSSYELLLKEKQAKRNPNEHWLIRFDMRSDFNKYEQYYLNVLKPYYAIWNEAILAAVFDFSLKELGIKNIYMHHFDTGNKLKDLKWSKPPKSIYTKLPRSFGFKLVEKAPSFLKNSTYLKRVFRRKEELKWYNIEF